MQMQASQKRRFVDAALDAKEAAPAAATAGQAAGPINAEEAAPLAVATQASKKRKSAAVALNYKVPAPDTVTAVEVTAAPLQASNKCKFQIIDVDQDPPQSRDVDDAGSVDHIGRLPDAVLCSIVSLLPTKEGARTQVISRRWRPLWRSAPLNLVMNQELNSNNHNLGDLIPKILSVHPGPARRFSLCLSNSKYHGKIKGWLSSQALDRLQEFELIPERWFDVRGIFYLLPSSVYRFAPTLRVAKFGACRFSNLIVKLSLKFPCLKQLTLDRVTISEDALHSVLFGCSALESLELNKNSGFGRLCISSQTLKSIGFCTNQFSVPFQKLVIKDAPCLERLLPLEPRVGPRTIRVISAPRLNILGVLSTSITELQLGTTVFRSMIAVGLTTKMQSVRVLVLDYTNLDIVVNFLKCFPCLERLHVFFRFQKMSYNNRGEYDPPEPIECLELHLKEVLFKNYDSTVPLCIDFAKFFVLNAKVLKEMKITLPYHRQYNWFANQHRLLRTKDRISQDARIELRCGNNVYFRDNRNTHDLSMADPFDVPSSGCKKCSGSPF
nr:F-box/FBD/LRR-repeat protein At1g16930 [Aegilops tauschii subsp. strangulata]XP_045086351.1 F-box/FBD/LRR-repeat protein At1g16930 [Aegilops tauschii subsp. strangulata]XP_045086354.1 F-box/FBD/LRR-repeat protein At1g16930 [Aegilops tauschii subsp. strangulata]